MFSEAPQSGRTLGAHVLPQARPGRPCSALSQLFAAPLSGPVVWHFLPQPVRDPAASSLVAKDTGKKTPQRVGGLFRIKASL